MYICNIFDFIKSLSYFGPLIMKHIFFVIFLLIVPFFLSAQSTPTPRQEKNLKAFAKLYGYVRFFHPSDEVPEINIYRFATYGAIKMLDVKTDKELIETLIKIFKPIAPSVEIFYTKKNTSFNKRTITPLHPDDYDVVSWQHLGLGFKNQEFSSLRVNRAYSIEAGDRVSFPLSNTTDLSRYRGRKFNFSFIAYDRGYRKTTENLSFLASRNKLVEDKKTFYSLRGNGEVDAKKKLFHFSGIVDNLHPFIVFNLSMNRSERLSIDSVKLEVIDNNKVIPIDISSKTALSSDPLPYTIVVDKTEAINRILYPEQARIGDFIKKEISPGISCIVPTALYGTRNHTYPVVDSSLTRQLNDDMYQAMAKDKTGNVIDSGDILFIRLSDVITSWNVLKHSFPYWNNASTSAENILDNAIMRAFRDNDHLDFLKSLQQVYAPLNDAWLNVYLNDGLYVQDHSFAPLILTIAEHKVVVKEVQDTNLLQQISRGDVVDSIDGKSAFNALSAKENLISGSPQWKVYKGLNMLVNGPSNSVMDLTINKHGTHQLTHVKSKRNSKGRFNGFMFIPHAKPMSGYIKAGIFYLNLSTDSINNHMTELRKAEAVIIDLRNSVLKEYDGLLAHLALADSSYSFYSIPKIDDPDFEKIKYQPLIKAIHSSNQLFSNVFLLTDASTFGDAERLAAFVKRHHLGTIIGQSSAGSYGRSNTAYLIGDFSLTYSGMLINGGGRDVLRGISPDILVNPHIKDLSNGMDEILQRAIEQAQAFGEKNGK